MTKAKKTEENLEMVLNILAEEGAKLGTEDLEAQEITNDSSTNDAFGENKGNDALENTEIDKEADILQKENTKNSETPDVLEISETNQNDNINTLYSVDELVSRFRVPSWQQAALLRLMDVEDDALVHEDDFTKGLERLSGRKMGTRN